MEYQHGGSGRRGAYASADYPHDDWSRRGGGGMGGQRGSGGGFNQRGGYRETAGPGDNRSSMYGSDYQSQTSHRGKGPKNYMRSDERIKEDLSERLMEDDATDASSITINVKDGIVTLDGSVEQRWVKHRVEDMAEGCSGVKDVINHLRVGQNQGSGGSSGSSSGGSGSGSSASGTSGSGSGMGSGGSSATSGTTSGGSTRGKSSNLS